MVAEEQIEKVRAIEKQLVAALEAEGLTVKPDRFGALAVEVCGLRVGFNARIGMSKFGSYRMDRFHSEVSGTWISGHNTLPRRIFDGEIAKPEETIAKVVAFVKKRVTKIKELQEKTRERMAQEAEEKRRAQAAAAESETRRVAAARPARDAGFTHPLHGGIVSKPPDQPLTWSILITVPASDALSTLELLEAHGLVPKREA